MESEGSREYEEKRMRKRKRDGRGGERKTLFICALQVEAVTLKISMY